MPTLRDWLADRPFTLVLSSGFFGFFAHAGVVRFYLDGLPRVGPFRLERGPEAMARAAQGVRLALSRPVS